ncbi:uncharacterized protein N7482_010149 [Penicillium canariense]|uniref:Peptidase S8/S53 domain-containing protein n=1 Tax=Penicillium canariense TaxID=189055 RepID=A0A9W9HMG4_9EURO|nr:uncharacterized protein N7482_010149 [Penicillium canariense]KAJ5150897.1 hypothetical protein N7482_010149 [Penicillium canariense]
MSIISINGNQVDPEEQRPVLQALDLESEDAAKSDYILVQSVEPLSNEQEDELERLGVNIQEYASKNTYLCGFKGTDLDPIRRLPYVSWVNVYLDMFVIQSSLKAPAGTMELSPFPAVPKDRISQTVDVLLHKEVDARSSRVLSEIAAAAHANPDTLDAGSSKIRLMFKINIWRDWPPLTESRPSIQFIRRGSSTTGQRKFSGPLSRWVLRGDGGNIRGTAPKATLVVQSLLDRNNNLGGIPTDFGQLFAPPYQTNGARIHTNSWGSSATGRRQLPYIAASGEIDKFVWDHQDMVILFAAGNDGIDADRNGIVDPRQIGAEAAAKNCITVGASENNRPEIPVAYGPRWPSGPISKDLMADHAEGLAAFSSRRPTLESRIKPDIVAPGTAILSTRSRNMVNADANFGASQDAEWWFLAGTSMATPLVAGCIAVLRETLVKSGVENPSAALLKAMMINGAVELSGQYVPSEAGPSPNCNSGFGRVNLSNSVILPNQTDCGYREGGPLTQGASEEIVVDIPSKGHLLRVQGRSSSTTASNGAVLKVSLVWTDPPGETLQNDLDLIVVSSDGTEKHGNMGDKPDFDRVNNVEQVEWTDIPLGKVKIIVRAYHIFNRTSAQPYALVWSINRPSK